MPIGRKEYAGHHHGRAFLVAATSGVSVSAVALPTYVSPLTVQPRRIPPIGRLPEIASGDGGFDHLFRVATAGPGANVVLTPQLRAAALTTPDAVMNHFKALTPAQRIPIMNMWTDNDPTTARRRR